MSKKWLVLLLLAAVVFVGCEKVKVEQWEVPFLNSLTGPIASPENHTAA